MVAAVAAYANDLRESVCVVEPQYTEAEKSTLGDFALWFSRKGLGSESRMLSAYKGGSTSSGVVIDLDGEHYVLTNRHVVGYAKDVRVSFVLRDTTVSFEDCPVYATCQDADLALVHLPKACTQPALQLATAAPEDGQDIVAAGFPGLGGKPSWQITKGAISNAYLQIEAQQHRFIQHTAPIDPGSSGGPLLVKAGEDYNILGINTLKAFRRDNVGIAIPAATVREFVRHSADLVAIDHLTLDGLTINGATWAKMLDKMKPACLDSLKAMDADMPLDVVTNTLAMDCAPDVKATASKAATAEKMDDYDNYYYVRAEYYNAFGRTQQINLAWENNRHYFVYGTVLSVMLDETTDNKLSAGFGLGFRMGAQVPLHMGSKCYAIPRFVVTPFVAPTGLIGAILDSASKLKGGIPLSVGNDFAFPVGNYVILAGIHYMYDFSFYGKNHDLVFDSNRRLIRNGNRTDVVGKSSLSVSFAFGW